jgi:hypothetical protein
MWNELVAEVASFGGCTLVEPLASVAESRAHPAPHRLQPQISPPRDPAGQGRAGGARGPSKSPPPGTLALSDGRTSTGVATQGSFPPGRVRKISPFRSPKRADDVDPAYGTDDTNHGGAYGHCGYKTLTYALAHATGQTALQTAIYSPSSGETFPIVPASPSLQVHNGQPCNHPGQGQVRQDPNQRECRVRGNPELALQLHHQWRRRHRLLCRCVLWRLGLPSNPRDQYGRYQQLQRIGRAGGKRVTGSGNHASAGGSPSCVTCGNCPF